MPRRPRLTVPGVPLHQIQRGNNRQICFVTDDDCRFYLEWLDEYAEQAGCRIHAYALMSNHVHLLVTPDSHDAASTLMKRLAQWNAVGGTLQVVSCAGHGIPSALLPLQRAQSGACADGR